MTTTVSRLTTCRVVWKINIFSPVPPWDHESCAQSDHFALFDVPDFYLIMWKRIDSGIDIILSTLSTPRVHAKNNFDRVSATFGIKKAGGSVGFLQYTDFTISEKIFDPVLICSLKPSLWKRMDRWVDDGNLTMIFSFSLENDTCGKSDSQSSVGGKHYPVLVKNFEDLLLSERGTDVTIKVLGHQFNAHKAVLVARSSVFASMFEHDMVEKQSCVVNIEDCDPESFRDFLLYLYTGKTEHITPSKAVGLYKTADKYAIQELKVTCSHCMGRNLSLDSFCDVISIATVYGESELLKAATDFFIKHFKEILRLEKWGEFHARHTELVSELLLKMADKLSI